MNKQEPITLTKEETEAIEDAVAELTPGPIAAMLRNLLERTKNNNEQSEQMEIAREVMKQDSECLRNLSKNNDDTTKNFES
jgi:hypothetical protein